MWIHWWHAFGAAKGPGTIHGLMCTGVLRMPAARSGVPVDFSLVDPASPGLHARLDQHFIFTVNESFNSSKALLTIEFYASRA